VAVTFVERIDGVDHELQEAVPEVRAADFIQSVSAGSRRQNRIGVRATRLGEFSPIEWLLTLISSI
jgi:hypothetical protein